VFSSSQGSELLSPISKISGVYIPVAFRLYKTYESNADENYDLTIAYPQYRESLALTFLQSQNKDIEQFMPPRNLNNTTKQTPLPP